MRMPAGALIKPAGGSGQNATQAQMGSGSSGQPEESNTPLGKISELVQKGYLEDLVAEATRSGRLNVLQHLTTFTSACCWKTKICTIAAAEGQSEVLQWARAEGCPWDADTFRQACLSG